MQNKHDMKKPLKAIEPVNVDLIKKGDNHYYSENKQDKGLKVDVVENKEGRVPDLTPKNYISNDNFERQSRALFNDILKAFGSEYELTKGMPTKYEVGSNGDILNAISKLLKKKTPLNISSINNWQQSQSIEGIVGFVLEFKHPKTGEVRTSSVYTPLELLALNIEDIQDKTLDCDCKPTGESMYKDCNCGDYLDEFIMSRIIKSDIIKEYNNGK